jgi:peptidoglycan/xylan/chitin deacetylase (PgdA/CDA1 family)
MEILKEDGYRIVGLEEAWDLLREKNIKDKIAVITFDDGYLDFLTEAFPVLNKYGFKATVFLSTGLVGKKNSIFLNKPCLTWGQIKELKAEGISFGSHTVTHPRMERLQPGEMAAEITQSKKDLEQNLGEPARTFSCPYAFPGGKRTFLVRYLTLLKEAGYSVAVSTRIGLSGVTDGPYMLKRIPINNFDDHGFFRAKLSGGYDWVVFPQHVFKSLKTGIRKMKLEKQRKD